MLKKIVRKILRFFLNDYLLRIIFKNKNGSFINENTLCFSDKNSHVFFGYYDISPFSEDGKILLSQKTEIDNRPPKSDDILKIGYYRLDKKNTFIELGETNTWNWQQGCRLQWFKLFKKNSHIIYNKMIENKFSSIVQNIYDKKIIKIYNEPVYCLSEDSKNAITLNFSRLGYYRPGYGYVNFEFKDKNDYSPKDDGIKIIDMNSGNTRMLFSIFDVTKIKPKESMKGAIHYFNHPCFSPNGKRFLFLHIWVLGNERFTRLITSDLKGCNIHILNNEGMSSHYAWKTSTEILSFALNSQGKKAYFVYQDEPNGRIIEFGKNIMKEDGHPSFSNSGKLICDTYPNFLRQQDLFRYNEKSKKYNKVISFYNPKEYYGEFRCDLHPRWNFQGNKVCVDSPNEGLKRKQYVVNVYD